MRDGDFLARDRELAPVDPGELLAVRDTGAYGIVMASNYNMRPRPAEALIEAAPRGLSAAVRPSPTLFVARSRPLSV